MRIEIGRAGLRNPTPCIETPALCAGNQVFAEHLPWLLAISDLLLLATSDRWDRLLPPTSDRLPGGDERSATSSSSWWTFAGLHCERLPPSTVVRYFKQRTMSTSANGAAGAFATGPPLGIILNDYILFLVCLQYLQCLSLIWVAINLHTCTYMPPLYFV